MSAFTWFLSIYVGSALVIVAGLWFWHDRKDRQQFEESRRRKVFHCIRCGSLYSVRMRDVEQGQPCPKCQYNNYELSF